MARQAQARGNGKSGGRTALRAAALRQIHTYVGALIAPSVLFFAATGALQLFSLHEAHGDYKPPRLFEQLGSIHKDQRFADKPKPEGASPPAADHHGAEADHDGDDDHDHDHAAPSWRTTALKWLFLGVAISLIVSTTLGLWMAVTFSRRKTVIWAMLILGTAAPLAILFL